MCHPNEQLIYESVAAGEFVVDVAVVSLMENVNSGMFTS